MFRDQLTILPPAPVEDDAILLSGAKVKELPELPVAEEALEDTSSDANPTEED